MKRRKFLWYTSAATISIIFPIYSCSSKQELIDIISIPDTLSYIRDEKCFSKVGHMYSMLFRDESDPEILKNLLLEKSGQDENSVRSIKDINIGIKRSIKQDFESNNILILNGWVLSRTEARQCALFSLINI